MIKVKSTSLDFGKLDREPIDLLIANGCEFESVQVDANSEEQGIAVVKDADVLVVGLQRITERVLAAAGRLKVIGRVNRRNSRRTRSGWSRTDDASHPGVGYPGTPNPRVQGGCFRVTPRSTRSGL